jgi:DNA polymerase V
MKKRAILCFDLKSFYASVECALRNLNPYTTPLVVADPARAGSIVLAVSPYLRAKGYPSRMRLYEVNKV